MPCSRQTVTSKLWMTEIRISNEKHQEIGPELVMTNSGNKFPSNIVCLNRYWDWLRSSSESWILFCNIQKLERITLITRGGSILHLHWRIAFSPQRNIRWTRDQYVNSRRPNEVWEHLFLNSKIEIIDAFCRFSSKFPNFQKILSRWV